MEDPGERGGEETVHGYALIECVAQEQELGKRARVEGEGNLRRHRIGPTIGGGGLDRPGELQPVLRAGCPHEPERRHSRARFGSGRRVELGGGQEVGEWVEVVADADPALSRGLERRRAAPGERIEDDVARPAVAGDERVREGRREARQVRAHRVQRVAPQAGLRLPVGLDRKARNAEAELELPVRGTT